MASALLWAGANGSLTLEGNGAALNDDAIVELDDAAFDPATQGYVTHGWLEVTADFSVTPSDTEPSLDIYLQQAPDGTNYENAPAAGGAQCAQQFLMSIPILKTTAAQRRASRPFLIPPHRTKFWAVNKAGQQIPAGWTVKLHYNTLEGQ